jgi:hypothetical protein
MGGGEGAALEHREKDTQLTAGRLSALFSRECSLVSRPAQSMQRLLPPRQCPPHAGSGWPLCRVIHGLASLRT